MTDIYVPLSTGGTVYFAQPDALKVRASSRREETISKRKLFVFFKGSLVETLREVRPTTFFGVPRVWEKIYEKMQAIGKQTRGIKKTISTWFVCYKKKTSDRKAVFSKQFFLSRSKSVGLSYNRRRMEGYKPI